MTHPVLIDTDTGIDDAVALALASRLEPLRVVCVTTVHGNTEVGRAARNAREVARRVGLRVPVIAGAPHPLCRPAHPARETHGPEGLGYHIPAVSAVEEEDCAARAILDAAAAHPGLTLCCLGPLTNIAHALRLDPSLPGRTGPLFIMGGTVEVRGTQTEWSEFNWWADPEAVQIVLAAGFDIRLVPLDVTRRIAIPGTAIRALREVRDDPDARFWERALAFYADFHRSWERFDGCIVNDALAVALAADPSLADWSPMRVGVVTGSEDARRGALIPGSPADPLVRVALGVRAAEVISLVGRTVFGRWLGQDAFRDGAAAAARWLADHPRSGTAG